MCQSVTKGYKICIQNLIYNLRRFLKINLLNNNILLYNLINLAVFVCCTRGNDIHFWESVYILSSNYPEFLKVTHQQILPIF